MFPSSFLTVGLLLELLLEWGSHYFQLPLAGVLGSADLDLRLMRTRGQLEILKPRGKAWQLQTATHCCETVAVGRALTAPTHPASCPGREAVWDRTPAAHDTQARPRRLPRARALATFRAAWQPGQYRRGTRNGIR